MPKTAYNRPYAYLKEIFQKIHDSEEWKLLGNLSVWYWALSGLSGLASGIVGTLRKQSIERVILIFVVVFAMVSVIRFCWTKANQRLSRKVKKTAPANAKGVWNLIGVFAVALVVMVVSFYFLLSVTGHSDLRITNVDPFPVFASAAIRTEKPTDCGYSLSQQRIIQSDIQTIFRGISL